MTTIKRTIRTIMISSITFLFCMCTSWQADFEHAHPNAQKLMTDEFLWNPIEDSSPFGNDDGADAVYKFYEWRKQNDIVNPVEFVDYILKEWNYPEYDYTQIDTTKIQTFIDSKEFGKRLYIGIDEVIISTGFGQLVIEGKIDKELKTLTLTALKRQLLPFSLRLFESQYRISRENNIKRMIEIINAA